MQGSVEGALHASVPTLAGIPASAGVTRLAVPIHRLSPPFRRMLNHLAIAGSPAAASNPAMTSVLRGVRLSLVLLAAGTSIAAGGGTAAAQSRAPGAVVQPLPGSEGAELRRHLADLAANPRSLASLIGAGRAAVRVGDGEAALGFFGRAEQVAPNDARVKAGMASAYVLLGQPQQALRAFAEAARLGAPEAELARDRGLA